MRKLSIIEQRDTGAIIESNIFTLKFRMAVIKTGINKPDNLPATGYAPCVSFLGIDCGQPGLIDKFLLLRPSLWVGLPIIRQVITRRIDRRIRC